MRRLGGGRGQTHVVALDLLLNALVDLVCRSVRLLVGCSVFERPLDDTRQRACANLAEKVLERRHGRAIP
jgi:hypothetical protein